MFKFSKKLEYALISLRHFADSGDEIVSAKDISLKYNIPSDLLAKILQKLKKENILTSVQGLNGGYKLNVKLDDLYLMDLFKLIDNSTSIAECMADEAGSCYVSENCTIKDPISKMQSEFENILKSKRVSDFV
jgi:Rrf2 family protein